MQRPKQQALAFLLGAVLVGGVVGFVSGRVTQHEESTIASRRKALYDDLGLETRQRSAMDSLLDDSNCQLDALLQPLQPALDSVKFARRAQINLILNPDQRARLDVRRKDEDARHDAERQRIQAACRK
jgi:hypothetical protein